MTKHIEDKLNTLPLVRHIVSLFKTIKLPGFEGLSFYDLLELYVIGVVKGALTTRASAIAFSFFTALFPFLLFVLILIPYIPIDNFKVEFIIFLQSFLPPKTSDFFIENIFENIDNSKQSGLLSSVFLLSIVLMGNGVNAIFSGFKNSYHEPLTRSAFKQYLYALSIALILAFLLIITIIVLGYFEIYIIQNLIHVIENNGYTMGKPPIFLANVAEYLFFIIMIYTAIATLYHFGTLEGKHTKFFSASVFFTTGLILITSYLFGLYIEHFGQYNKLYGSIGGLLILLFYLWLNANILLLGYELKVSINKLKKRS